jgi:PhnB protein
VKEINPYLTFNGNAREAMSFYATCLGADLQVQTFAEAKMEGPPGTGNRVIHARLSKGAAVLLASDTMPGMPFDLGSNNFSVTIQCSAADEVDRLFQSLSAGGKGTMPPQDTFWNARFAMMTDRFGVNWMLNFDKSGRTT